jgi:hypothetical protein
LEVANACFDGGEFGFKGFLIIGVVFFKGFTFHADFIGIEAGHDGNAFMKLATSAYACWESIVHCLYPNA